MDASLLTYVADVDNAPRGTYIARAGTPAYFPTLALIEAGHAKLVGEMYVDVGRVITVEVTKSPPRTLGADDDIFSKRQITIGRQFFITALKDYRDWPEKWWREVVQNAVDAGARHIDLTVKRVDDGFEVACEDDGSGMDAETVMNKFLVLGETTKTAGSGKAGGFGKAKELILLPWVSWRIHSRDVAVDGVGDQITNAGRTVFARTGTRLSAVMPPDMTTTDSAAISFIEKCYLPDIRFTVNGKEVKAALAPGHPLSATTDVSIHFTPAQRRQWHLYVRTRGLYMFAVYVGEMPGYVIAELLAPSVDVLTANRDGFRDYGVAAAVERLGQRIAKDNMSALKNAQGMVDKKYVGTGKFHARRLAAQLLDTVSNATTTLTEADTRSIIDVVSQHATREREKPELIGTPPPEIVSAMLDHKFRGPRDIEAAMRQLAWEPDFYITNEREGFKVPKKFFPESMTPTILKLAKTWVEMCRFVLIQLGSDVQFGVGFVFSDSAGAMCLKDEEGDGWLLLNPIATGDGHLLRPTADNDLKWLYAAAIHEATHMADGLSYHDESFASALTHNVARCADGYRKIKQIAAGIKMRGGAKADITDDE